MPVVAFFPWLSLKEPLTVGRVRLIPWKRGEAPGDSEFAQQADLDAVFSAYLSSPGHRLLEATLLEVGDWRIGQDANDETRGELFELRDLIGFAALSKRELFAGHFGYTNFDAYQFIVQNYISGRADRFAFNVKRRDGWASHYWTASSFAFARAHHVSTHGTLELDLTLLDALTKGELPSRLYDAIAEFNQANTDSPDVQTHLELIRAKTSLEWLLGVGSSYPELLAELEKMLPPRAHVEGPLRAKWSAQYPKAPTLITKWAQEFCVRRGMSAHASNREGRLRGSSDRVLVRVYFEPDGVHHELTESTIGEVEHVPAAHSQKLLNIAAICRGQGTHQATRSMYSPARSAHPQLA